MPRVLFELVLQYERGLADAQEKTARLVPIWENRRVIQT